MKLDCIRCRASESQATLEKCQDIFPGMVIDEPEGPGPEALCFGCLIKRYGEGEPLSSLVEEIRQQNEETQQMLSVVAAITLSFLEKSSQQLPWCQAFYQEIQKISPVDPEELTQILQSPGISEMTQLFDGTISEIQRSYQDPIPQPSS